jgi:hypothetical protein
MGLKGVLRTIEGGDLGFWCAGCEEMHVVSPGWTFDGNYDAPTFSPSVLVTNGHYCPGHKPGDSCWCTYNREHADDPSSFTCSRCHSFVRGGRIEFLGDCTHKLAGQTVTLTAPPETP